MVTTLLVMPVINICHVPSPSLRLAACPLEHQVFQQVDSSHVHIKAFRTESHLLYRSNIPWRYSGFSSGIPEYSEDHNKVSYTKFLVSQGV